MRYTRIIGVVAGVLFTTLGSSPASATTASFLYTVTGQANAVVDPNTGILTYAFVPTGAVMTRLGALTVNYNGTIDLLAVPPSGTTNALWAVAGFGTFFGPGIEFIGVTDPNTLLAPFKGTSTITGGTGIFAGATGITSYTGAFNVATGEGGFSEQIVMSGPGVPSIPEPAAWVLMVAGFGAVGFTSRRRRRNAAC